LIHVYFNFYKFCSVVLNVIAIGHIACLPIFAANGDMPK